MRQIILIAFVLFGLNFLQLSTARSDELCSDGRVLPNCNVDRELEKKCAPDYTVYSVPLETKLRLGAGFGNVTISTTQKNSNKTGDISLIFLVDMTRLAVEGGLHAGAGDAGGYGGGKISLSMRKNFDKNECSKWWYGFDPINVSGRYSSLGGVDSYLSGKIPAYVGYFTQVGNRCVLQLYGEAGVAWFDDRAPSEAKTVKPLAGGKGVFRCKNGIDVYATSASLSVDRLFNIGSDDSYVSELDFSHMFSVKSKKLGPLQLGVYLNGQLWTEDGMWGDENRKMGRIMGGIQLMRY